MRAVLVRYERVHNLGNYENERVGIDIQLDEGEKADEALRLARLFVNRGLRPDRPESDGSEIEMMETEFITEGA